MRWLTGWQRIALGMFIIGYGANSFAPMLLTYRFALQLSEKTVTFLLAAYIFGLIPALLLGGRLSDKVGRRALMRPALVISALSSLILTAAHPVLLGIGRWTCGIAVGFVMSSGAAWLREIANAPAAVSARRATIATSAGFGGGPLITGLLAQWGPAPLITPWLAHAITTALIALLAWNLPEAPAPRKAAGKLIPSIALSSRFLWSVAAWAPWVFGCSTTSFAVLVSLTSGHFEHKYAFAGIIAAITMFVGVAVQPLVPRLGSGFVPPAIVGLALAFIGMVLGFVIATTHQPHWIWPAAVFLGAAYGIMMVSGLREVQTMAPSHELGGLIGIYYSMTYLGFFVPYVFSIVAPLTGYRAVFVTGMIVIVASVWPVTHVIRKYEPRS